MIRISAYFHDLPGSPMDRECRRVFDNYGCQFVGAGNMLVGSSAGERDVQYDVDDTKVADVRAALVNAGFRLKSIG